MAFTLKLVVFSTLIIMLGTNDTKERFGANATCIALGMERLVRKAQAVDCWGPNGTPNLLIVCPPAIDPRMETSEIGGCMGAGCAQKSAQLAALLAGLVPTLTAQKR